MSPLDFDHILFAFYPMTQRNLLPEPQSGDSDEEVVEVLRIAIGARWKTAPAS
jgi:hypothetical protein